MNVRSALVRKLRQHVPAEQFRRPHPLLKADVPEADATDKIVCARSSDLFGNVAPGLRRGTGEGAAHGEERSNVMGQGERELVAVLQPQDLHMPPPATIGAVDDAACLLRVVAQHNMAIKPDQWWRVPRMSQRIPL